jgi:FtsH-binding integral membrane protein
MPPSYPFQVSGLSSDARPYALDTGERTAFLRKVYGLVLLGIVSSGLAGGVAISSGAALQLMQHYWIMMLVYFGLFFGCMAGRRIAGLNILLLIGFTAFTGVMVAPAVYFAPPGAAANALLGTGVAFTGLSVYAAVTKRDLSFMRTFLVTSLFAIIAVSLGNIFFFKSTAMDGALAGVTAVLFCGFIAYDTQRLMRNQAMDDAVGFALSIYLDILNLFLALLRIFSRRR